MLESEKGFKLRALRKTKQIATMLGLSFSWRWPTGSVSQTKDLVWDATRFQPKPLDSTGLGLDKLQVQWIEIRRKMFDANQMFSRRTDAFICRPG